MKLQLIDKRLLLSKVIEELYTAGYDFSDLLFVPSSKFDYKKILNKIILLEKENEVDYESSFLNAYPIYKQLLD
jgi:hypothetical protein